MPTQTPKKTAPQVTDPPEEKKQGQVFPAIKAVIDWMNPNGDENVKAKASMTVGGAFAVHGIRVIDSAKGEFVSMPSYKGQDGYKDIFHAITKEAREQMNEAVMDAYEQKLAEQMDQDQSDTPANDDPAETPDESQDTGMQGMNQ